MSTLEAQLGYLCAKSAMVIDDDPIEAEMLMDIAESMTTLMRLTKSAAEKLLYMKVEKKERQH